MFLRSQKLNLRLEKVPRDQGDCLDRRGTIATEGFNFGSSLGRELFGGGPYRNFISQQVTLNCSALVQKTLGLWSSFF